ncbi:hypothetical protein Y710_05910 [Gordonia sp. QH-12]|uniref:DUF222 domain-containing protein n=2 Tax=Gordonia TaxID=2053 RepID=UPI0005F040E6|nr:MULTISPECIES: DUF222 domain-containing protein [Gordonia]KJR01771.1 hypothetical protein UG54_19150 [Gordonia sihwensis]KXT57692.1 hypothetical protein Y710_05910 [Gordonia sp. QH-12]
MNMQVREHSGSSVVVDDGSIVIRIGCPAGSTDGSGSDAAAVSRADRAALLTFAARADCYQGLVMWHRYQAVYSLYRAKQAELEADASVDAYTRLFDPQCQMAASYATAAGVRQYAGELFVDRAIACFERIPSIGRLMRYGVLTPGWFVRAVEQTALVDDGDLLAFIDAEIAHRLAGMGGLSANRVESTVAAIVAEHDPDAATLTREQVASSKKVSVTPVADGVSEMVIVGSTEDAAISLGAINALADGVCPFDPRTKQARRSDAATALLQQSQFTCLCERDDCVSELAPAQIDARRAQVMVHVVVRKEALDGVSQLPAYEDGVGPISARHARELVRRPDAVIRELDLDTVIADCMRHAGRYRPSAAVDTAVRALFGTCTVAGCDRPAWKSDLDHVVEFDHRDPGNGGPTCVCNLNPKCRFHHGVKTHAEGWVDDQIVDANGVIWTEVTTPDGMTVRRQAMNLWLLPELGHIQCRHGVSFGMSDSPATRPENRHAENEPERRLTRTQAKHRYRTQRRAANRRQREIATVTDGEPPF